MPDGISMKALGRFWMWFLGLTGAFMFIATIFPNALGPGPEERRQIEINELESRRKMLLADLVRGQADCQATAIEFSGHPSRETMVSLCLDTLRTQREVADKLIADIDRRLEKLNLKSGG